MIDINFIILSYIFGPVISIPYAIEFLSYSPLEIFIILSSLYIIILPFIFKIFEFLGHRKIYRGNIIKKVCKICGIKAEEEVQKIKKKGDILIENFEKRAGHLGFYIAISVFTFLFGIFWATFLAYLLKVKRILAMWSISIGVLIGNSFWVLILTYSLSKLQLEFIQFILLLIFVFLLFYGRRREIKILKKISGKLIVNIK